MFSTVATSCCELISNCIFTWAITSLRAYLSISQALWIDFKLYFYVSNHKFYFLFSLMQYVVNWFQIVFLREQSQVQLILKILWCSCELISNCMFTWAITSVELNKPTVVELWIDFKLYFYVSNHKVSNFCSFNSRVVNWFQIVFLREQSQDNSYQTQKNLCCELISNCIFTWAITST